MNLRVESVRDEGDNENIKSVQEEVNYVEQW
jgi:hypothetical protein